MSETKTNPSRYIANPDVVIREEDPDGGLLFNPDTNQIRVVNQTGLFIYKQCDGSKDLPAIISAVRDEFDEVPADQVDEQVKTFIDEMVSVGFIGFMEEQKQIS